VIAFSGVLWGISKPLVFSLCSHRHLVTTPFLVNHLFGSTLNNSKKEADSALVWIRENAEAIAFTGAKSGVELSNSDFLEAFDNVKRLLIWELNLNVLTNA